MSEEMLCTNCGEHRAATRLGLTLCVKCAGLLGNRVGIGAVRHIYMGGGHLIPVRVIAHEQAGKYRGQWVVVNEATGRKMHRTTRQLRPAHVRFTADDPAGLWRAGEYATDLGPESDDPEAPPIRLLRMHRTGEVLALTDPVGRELVHRVV